MVSGINRLSIQTMLTCSGVALQITRAPIRTCTCSLGTQQVDLSRTETTNAMLEVFAPRLFRLRTINLASCRQVRVVDIWSNCHCRTYVPSRFSMPTYE